ncbi:FxSxx-COOH system tetratricopeptide repeat protein [Streptomyces gardneri]|uniref:Tetratricopeptide repeat protein n=1 Tax=Streptomyces gardneri TaxID=66892 RepID=A0A4Y3RSQ7_9ACTN|nr:FxSxx-COOH system tetratricopeptide repeat protein [Streptomyces gardneri]GEB60108.1 tetratricopeptide repeat protein [Streptomyces gardneri]GHH21297.1 tetratricopeptide repeat protein [Streptomyces gardneri]
MRKEPPALAKVVPQIEASGKGSVVIDGHNYGLVMTGDGARAVELPAEALRPPAQVDAPPGLDDLPLHRGPFVGRTSELQRLDAALAAPGGVLVQAVHGLGGVGKSTLAAHWAATRSHGCVPIRWINADSPTGVHEGLVALATSLQPALAEALTQGALAEYALQWLATHTGWLLILDNVNDPGDIAPLLARAPGGRFLITSRLATTWHDVTTVVRLDVLDQAEAVDLLTRRAATTAPGRNMDGAAELCAELGYLPLAVEQAGAYLAQNLLTTPRAYLDLIGRDPAMMYDQGAVGIDPERTIARIWRATLNRITADQPLAADLLRTLAWYAPDHIPAELLGDITEPVVNAAVGLLTAYSMITADPATGTLSMHRLVQAVARTPDPDDAHRQPQDIDAAQHHAIVGLSLPDSTHSNRAAWFRLAPHVAAYCRNAPAATDSPWVARALNNMGVFLDTEGFNTEAVRYLERAFDFHQRPGKSRSNPEAHAVRGNLAIAYGNAGFPRVSLPLAWQSLQDNINALGEEHPRSLTALNNVAGALYRDGRLADATSLYERSLQLHTATLGADHPHTLTARNNMAIAYQRLGRVRDAVTLLEENLRTRKRVLGEDHPQTLLARVNLADAYKVGGRLGDALRCFAENADSCRKFLGAAHPTTLASDEGIAAVYQAHGETGRAIALLEETLLARRRLHGDCDPRTLECRNQLAQAYQAAGDLPRAIGYFEENVTLKTDAFGEDAPTTLLARNNLAHALLGKAGHACQAVRVFEDNLARRERVLGPTHPDTLVSLRNLAFAAREAGDQEGALKYLRLELHRREQTLGANHTDTVVSRENLAFFLAEIGRVGQAIPLLQANLALRLRHDGPDHPDTIAAYETLQAAAEYAEDEE